MALKGYKFKLHPLSGNSVSLPGPLFSSIFTTATDGSGTAPVDIKPN